MGGKPGVGGLAAKRIILQDAVNVEAVRGGLCIGGWGFQRYGIVGAWCYVR